VHWGAWLWLVGSLLLANGLLARSHSPTARTAQIRSIVGALLLIAHFLVVSSSALSGPIAGLISALGPPLFGILGVAGLWIGSRQLDLTLAWLVLGWPFLAQVLTLPSQPSILDQLVGILYMPLALTAWMAMVCYGAASVLGARVADSGQRK
jgi:hypothetical protein